MVWTVLKEEFSGKNFALRFHRVDVFCTAQWPWHRAVFPAYRLLMSAYIIFAFVDMLAVSHPTPRLLAFLTVWTYLIETLFFAVGAVLAVLYCWWPRLVTGQSGAETSGLKARTKVTFQNRAIGPDPGTGNVSTVSGQCQPAETRMDPNPGGSGSTEKKQLAEESSEMPRGDGVPGVVVAVGALPWFVQFYWLVSNIVQVFAPIVSIVYFAALYPYMRASLGGAVTFPDMNLHCLNTLMVLADAAVSARPVRLLHVLYALLYGVTYVAFSLVFWRVDPVNNVLYVNVLDWNQPGLSAGVVVGLALVGIPLLQLAHFGLYQLRVRVYRGIYRQPG